MDVNSNIVVTGGAGFIGSHLVELLLAQGAHVTVIDDLSVGSQVNIQIENPSLSFVPCDIRSDTAKDIYADAEIVFHLAVKNVRASLPRPKENFDINATGTLEILEAMRNGARGKFVYFSSSEVYGNAVTSTFAETTVPHPTTIYAAGKLAGEHISLAFQRTYGMDTRVIRPFNHYGSRSHFGGDSGELIPKFILRALAGKDLIIHGTGDQTRDFSYVGDTPSWFLKIAAAPSLVGETMNIGSGTEISVLDVAKLVLKLTNSSSKIVHGENRPGDVNRLHASTEKLKSYFPDFGLSTNLETGIKETIKYFSGFNIEDALLQERENTWLV